MKTGTSLSGEPLHRVISDFFKTIPDHRDSSRIEIALKDFLMSGFAIFALKFESLLQFEKGMKKPARFSKLRSLFGVEQVPSDTHLRSVLDEIPTESFRPIFKNIFAIAQRNKVLEKYTVLGDQYLLSVDGTGYFYSDSIHCESCIEKKVRGGKEDERSYYHQMLAASIVHPDRSAVIPICPEPIQKQDGQTKNDCEQNAMKRFLIKYREDHPSLKTILLTDALHSTLPCVELLKKLAISYILSVKPGSHEKLFGAIEKWDELNRMRHFTREEEIGDKIKKKRIHEFRYWNGVLLNHQSVTTTVNFLDYTETTQWVDPKGRLKEEIKRFSWVTDYSLYDSSCEQIMRAGRTRWKVENETFNVLKNHGYEFEHNFGHGYKNLTANFAMLMMLAFLVDQLQEIGCKHFQNAIERAGRKCYFWQAIRATSFFNIEIKNWYAFLLSAVPPDEVFLAEKVV